MNSCVKNIILLNGEIVLVDEIDYEWLLNQGSWSLQGKGYARCSRGVERWMHRLVFRRSNGYSPTLVAHKDDNKLNNTRLNLLDLSYSMNTRAGSIRSDNTSGYKGVSFCTKTGRWAAFISLHGVSSFLGRFNTPLEASKAYENAKRNL